MVRVTAVGIHVTFTIGAFCRCDMVSCNKFRLVHREEDLFGFQLHCPAQQQLQL
jgi:hypothetical protein